MLEARNLKKEYKTKDSPVVKALDDVSVKFEETGMVFILGKSGSGKSTLLNVLGGLDSYDSGEVIVKGKSSKEFSGSDFDSYRNTFIGFIFQEYNILEEFTVSKNIGLALELQGKKADKAAINDLMEQVDLKGYGKRKPNTLSGGQKQRVAIARALVKNPEIIMADEPTGALDSNTGKQVLDTLKKLSKTKLVLIVSHDREFAERYGDRIIELADGKIISDIVKYKSEPKVSDGFEIVDDKILTIKKGTKLDATKSKTLKEFIEKHDEDIIVSVDEKANKEFKKFAMIDEEGNKESFKNTENLNIKEYDPKKFKLIKSKLPGKDSFKMGASGLKSKPIRLVFTIILSAIAFALFGLADTMGSYNKVDNTIKSIVDSKVDYASFSKELKSDNGNYTNSAKLSTADFNKLNKDLPGFTFVPVFDFGKGYSGTSFSNNIYSNDSKEFENRYYSPEFYGGIEINNDNVSKFGTVTGNLPTTDNEIVVTKYVFDMFKLGGYRSNGGTSTKVDIQNEEDLIGKIIEVSNTNYTIVGILDTKVDLTRYEKMKNEDFGKNGMQDYMTTSEHDEFISNSYHSLAYFKEGYFDRNIMEGGLFSKISNNDDIYGTIRDTKPSQNDYYGNNFKYIAAYNNSMNDYIVWKNGTKTTLADNEVVLSGELLNNMTFLVDGIELQMYEIIDGNKGTIFDKKLDNKLKELNVTPLEGQDTISTYEILSYFGNFDSYEQKYKTNSEYEDWKVLNYQYCSPDYYGENECDLDLYIGNINMHLTYNKITNKVSLNGVREFDVVDNKVVINNVEYEIREVNSSTYFYFNNGKANFINYYGKDLTQEQKDGIGNFLKNYTDVDILGDVLNISADSRFDELYNYRVSEDGLNEMTWTKENYKNYILSDIKFTTYWNDSNYAKYTDDEKTFILEYKKKFVSRILNYMQTDSIWLRTNINYNYEQDYSEYKIVGIYVETVSENADSYNSNGIISNVIYDKFSENLGGVYNFAISPLDYNNSEQVKAIVDYTYGDHGKIVYSLNNAVMSSIAQVNELIEMLSKIFLYVGIGFAVFASLLLLNFITISISYKKREIGVLRAIGARGMDVFRIFFNEAFIIAFINFILAFGGCLAVCIILNGVMRNNYGVLITVLNIGVRQVLLMFAISVAVAFISAFLPVNKIARKKPIDAIRNS